MTKRISLALQGGGAHGAFTWGALKRILEDPDIEIGAISGTSAGALNGAAVKAGLAAGEGAAGRRAAIAQLEWLWRQIEAVTDLRLTAWMNAVFPDPAFVSRGIEAFPLFAMADAASRSVSPYGYGPFYENPLRRIVEKLPFERVRGDAGPAFFVNATRVRNGQSRVFPQAEITTEVLLASACLPTVFQAIEIADGETGRTEEFWDGAYSGNPALVPLIGPALPDDVVIVGTTPMERDDRPRSPAEIQNRINEISFNAALLRELREIGVVKRLIAEGWIERGRMPDPNLHLIADDAMMAHLSVATTLVPTPYVIGRLRDAGHAAADRFLAAHKADLSLRSTLDLPGMSG